MIRKVTAVSAVAFGLLAPALMAGPATAGAGSTDVGCTDSSSCSIFLQKYVTYGGNHSQGPGLNRSVSITPPPCLWIPAGDATSGSQKVIDDGGGYAPPPAGLNTDAVKQAQKLEKNPQPGEWYELPVRDGDTPAETAACMKLPYYYWVAPGDAPPPVPIPPETLRDLAFAKLTVPQFQTMQLNPAGRSYTNLPTFVKARLPLQSYREGPGGQIYLAVTATANVPGGQSATVWVPAGTFTVAAPGAKTWTSPPCSVADSQGMLGSKWTQKQMQRTGPNEPIDCGATFTRPGNTTVTATLNWQAAVWAITGPDGYQNPPPGGAAPVPNGGALNPSQATRQVTVVEIQSINNGG